MRASVSAIHGMGDLVPGWFPVPQTPVGAKRPGMGDLVPGWFSVPQTPVGAKGMGHIGCGSDCNCGPCSSQGGMGQIDLSLTGDGIATSLGTSLGITSMPDIPNWVIYAAGIGIIYAIYSAEKGTRRR